MKSFTFRLETLLRLRKNSRDRALADYAKSIEQRESADKKVKEANLYLEKLNERVSLKSKSLFSGNEMITFQSQIKNAKDSKNRLLKDLSKLSSMESARRKVFLQKEAEFKSLDRFKAVSYTHLTLPTNREV